MATLQVTGINDLAALTLANFDRPRFTQVIQTLQNYEMMRRIFKKDREIIESGDSIERTLVIDPSGAAKMVGMAHSENPNFTDHTASISVPWRMSRTYWVYDIHEPFFNRGDAAIANMLLIREAAAMIALAKVMEDNGWGKPTDSNDVLSLWGVQQWIVPGDAPTDEYGTFTGGNPSGFSDIAGVDSSVKTRFRNYYNEYANVSASDLIFKMCDAQLATNFISPMDIRDARNGNGQRFRIYCNKRTLLKLQLLRRSQNDNLGDDVANYDGQLSFMRNAIVYVPKLDSDTRDPVYMLDMDSFEPKVKAGINMDRLIETGGAQQPTLRAVFIYLAWQLLCTDRRAQTLLRLAA